MGEEIVPVLGIMVGIIVPIAVPIPTQAPEFFMPFLSFSIKRFFFIAYFRFRAISMARLSY